MKRIKLTAGILEKAMNLVFTLCGLLAVVFVILITVFLLASGTPAIGEFGL